MNQNFLANLFILNINIVLYNSINVVLFKKQLNLKYIYYCLNVTHHKVFEKILKHYLFVLQKFPFKNRLIDRVCQNRPGCPLEPLFI